MPNQDQPNNNLTTGQPTVNPVIPVPPAAILPTPPPLISTDQVDTPPPPMIIASDSPPLEKSPVNPPPLDVSPMVVAGTGKKGSNKKAFVATILGLILLVGGVTAGLYLVGQKQDIREKAAVPEACSTASTAVCIGKSLGESCGENSTCEFLTGSDQVCQCRAQEVNHCLEIRVYKVTDVGTPTATWTKLSADDLSKLNADEEIYLAALVQSSSTEANGGFLGAEFSVNGVVRPEVTAIRQPSSPEGTTNTYLIYDVYTVPGGITNFDITARIHHSSGWF